MLTGNPPQSLPTQFSFVVNCRIGGTRDHEPIVCSGIAVLLTGLSA
jgi:hypothetical protein